MSDGEPEIRPVREEEWPAFVQADSAAFGGSPVGEDDIRDMREATDLGRTVAAFDRGKIVGTAASLAFQLTLPGNCEAPAAGITFVGVLPTHRRRGILRAMMRYQLDDLRARGEPLAILYASESLLYGRYGYGLSTTQADYTIARRHAGLRRGDEATGEVRLIGQEEAGTVLPALYDRVRRRQPGFVDRTEAWWRQWLADKEGRRRGFSARFYAVYRGPDGSDEGYAAYRIKSEWEHGFPKGTARVVDFHTVTHEAYSGLLQYLMALDLVETVSIPNRPLDEPLRWMLADPRRLQISEWSDHLWTRLIDPAAALAARRYLTADRLTFAVTDTFCPDAGGTYVLEGGPDEAECRRGDARPDISLEVADLGAAYLGNVRFSTLARAGRAEEHTHGALVRADTMFESEPPAWSSTDF